MDVRVTGMLGLVSNLPVRTTQRSNVDPSDREYSVLSIPIITTVEKDLVVNLYCILKLYCRTHCFHL